MLGRCIIRGMLREGFGMNKYLLLWGESPEYCYENPFDTAKEALDWVNNFGVKWNSTEHGHWFKFYEERTLLSDNMWEDLKKYVDGKVSYE